MDGFPWEGEYFEGGLKAGGDGTRRNAGVDGESEGRDDRN